MRTAAAILLVLCVAAAGALAQTARQPRASRESEAVEATARDAVPFEDSGVITDAELAPLSRFLRSSINARMNPPTVELIQRQVRALGRLERRDLIPSLSAWVADARLSESTHLALALTLRAHARPDQPDEEIARVVSGLVVTAPAAVLGQLPFSTTDQFEAAQARLAPMLESPQAPRATAARALETLARRN